LVSVVAKNLQHNEPEEV